MRKSSLQWSFSTSQFLSFKSGQEQGVSHKQYPPGNGLSQRNLGLDMQQGGSQYPIPSHPWQPKDVVSVNQSPEMRMFAGSNQILPATITSTTGPASCAATAVSVTPPQGPVVGSTDLKSSPSISTGPCQLTLFYNGSVCVYDNVSPEKAQAIMLLAGNGESKNSSSAELPPLQQSVLRPPAKDSAAAGLPSPIPLPSPISSLPAVASTSAIASTSAVQLNPIKSAVTSAHIKCLETLTSAASIGLKTTPSAVPQARKASLTRFLEKRKERVTTAAPYAVSKKGSEYNTVGSTLPQTPASSSPSTS
ncbi:Protein TIFY 6B [Bienertia sinuspersici]